MKDLLLIFLAVFLFFRLFRNQITRFVFSRLIKQFENANNRQNRSNKKPEGEVTIQNRSANKSSSGLNDVGEYVDFEEVK